MRAVLCVAAFVGWGVAGWLAAAPLSGLSFIIGLGVGAGAMLWKKEEPFE